MIKIYFEISRRGGGEDCPAAPAINGPRGCQPPPLTSTNHMTKSCIFDYQPLIKSFENKDIMLESEVEGRCDGIAETELQLDVVRELPLF